MNREEFITIIHAMAGNFSASLPNKETIKLWFDMFKSDGITIEQIKSAAMEIMRTRTVNAMPTYAEFRSHITGTVDDKAQIQADIVIEAIRRKGAYWEPKFQDSVTQKLMTSKWRWKSICETLMESQTPFFVRDFKEAYKTYAKPGIQIQAIEGPKSDRARMLIEKIRNVAQCSNS